MNIKESKSARLKRLSHEWEDHHASIANARAAFDNKQVASSEYRALRSRARALRNAVHAEWMSLAYPPVEPVVTPITVGDLNVLSMLTFTSLRRKGDNQDRKESIPR